MTKMIDTFTKPQLRRYAHECDTEILKLRAALEPLARHTGLRRPRKHDSGSDVMVPLSQLRTANDVLWSQP